jgi:sulfinoalanine decarboxylase
MKDINKILKMTHKIIIDLIKDETINPVLRHASPDCFLKNTDITIPDKGKGIDDLFRKISQVVFATPKTGSKKFFNQLFGGRVPVSMAADMIAAALNSPMHTYKVSAPHILIEKEVIRAMTEKIGYPQGDGIFAPGGSISNLIAMVIARNKKQKEIYDSGFDGRKYIAYTSDQGHYSVLKSANITGIGRRNVRAVRTDSYGKMDVDELQREIVKDLKNKNIPFFINATAGTTVLGAFDPLEKIAWIAKEFDIWFHVDGAFGGGLLLSDKYRHILNGCEKSDSFTWDAHKMMGVPLMASAFLLREKGLLEENLREEADYLYQGDEDVYNHGIKSIQCARRNDVFKVWTAWHYFGNYGYQKRVNRQVELAQYAASIIRKSRDLKLIMEPESINVCFEVNNESSCEICDILEREGMVLISHGTFKGKKFIRLVCVNPDMSGRDIMDFFKKVRHAVRIISRA